MKTHPIREEVWKEFVDVYTIVKNHPYRVNRRGSPAYYRKALRKLSETWSRALYDHFCGTEIVQTYPDGTEIRSKEGYQNAPDDFCMLFHDFNGMVGNIRRYEEHGVPGEIMIRLEHYINMAHDFKDTLEWIRFKRWSRDRNRWVEYDYFEDTNAFEYTDDELALSGNERLKWVRGFIKTWDSNGRGIVIRDRLISRMTALGIEFDEANAVNKSKEETK